MFKNGVDRMFFRKVCLFKFSVVPFVFHISDPLINVWTLCFILYRS